MRQQKLRRVAVLVHRCHLAPLGPVAQRGMRLHRQAVQGEVLGLERKGALQVGSPVPPECRRQAEDEVEREIVDAGGAERLDCQWDLVGGVGAVHPLEHGGIERLDAERHPVHAGGCARRWPLRRHVFRVGLQGDLGTGRDGPVGTDPVQHPGDGGRGDSRRRAAAEVDRVHLGRVVPDADPSARGSTP